MKILLCNTLEKKGGAAKSTNRLAECLQKDGVDVKILNLFKNSKESKSLIPKIDAIPKLLCSKKRKTPFSSSLISFGNKKLIKKYDPDILHLNYINMGMFSIKEIGSFKIPIVWTLHDSWTFTGGCHLPMECTKYTSKCSQCPALGSKRNFDLSTYIFLQKEKHWDFKNITLVCPSEWIANNAKRSKLFKNSKIHIIPNPIDTNLFKPKDKDVCKKQFNLNPKKKHILFGSVNPLKDKNKGFEYLQKAMKYIDATKAELIVFGDEGNSNIETKIPVKNLGYIQKETDMASLYSACNVTIMPSLAENLPNNLIESISCGTPCVGFKVGGIPEIISKEEFGKIVNKFDPKSLADAITKVLDKKNTMNRIKFNKEIQKQYGYKTIATKYKNLYETLTLNV